MSESLKSIIPDGWVYEKLGNVAERITKGGTPTTYGYSFLKQGINFIKVENISNGILNLKSIKDYISGDAHNFQAKSRLEENDLLFSIAGTIGVTCIIRKDYLPANTNQALAIIKGVSNCIDPKLLNYQLDSFVTKKTKAKARGGAMNNISLDDLKNLDIFIPPFSEQHRIITKMEELLSELNKGVEALKTARQQLKVYRQAVLNSAITKDISKTIEEVIVSIDQGWSPKCYNESSQNHNEWGVIKTTAIQAGYFQEMENKRLPEILQPKRQHELRKGDLLITRAGPRIRAGVCCLVKHIRPRLLNCDKVYRIRTDTKVVIPEYIEILLNSPKYSRIIDNMKTGISDSGVNLTQKGVLEIEIPLPSIDQQTKIVQEIETRLSVADKLEETISQSLQQAEALRQSILKKAFEGKLVPQDPDDEPASKLLERIRTEKAAQTPTKKTRKKKATK